MTEVKNLQHVLPNDGNPAEPCARTVAHAFGEIVWLMSQSTTHKHFTIADLEWMVMPPLLLKQFRSYQYGATPAGVLLWAKLGAEAGAIMREPRLKLRPDQWSCGEDIWVVDVITAGAPSQLVQTGLLNDFKQSVYPGTDIRIRQINPQTGAIDVLKIGSPPPETPTMQ